MAGAFPHERCIQTGFRGNDAKMMTFHAMIMGKGMRE